MPTSFETIQKLGLDESEAKVYSALMELGPSTVSEITAKAGITRTLGYSVLQKLAWHGLVNKTSGQNSKIKYSAEHPQQLLRYISGKKHDWDHRLHQAEHVLPELVGLFKTAEKPVIQYEEGVDGVKKIYEQTLKSKTEILSILDIEGWDVPEFSRWGREYNRKRSAFKISERILFLDTPKSREWMKDYRGSSKYTEYRWIKPEQLKGVSDFGGEINIYENKVVMALLKKPNLMGAMIESSALANILKGLFELAWTQGVEIKSN